MCLPQGHRPPFERAHSQLHWSATEGSKNYAVNALGCLLEVTLGALSALLLLTLASYLIIILHALRTDRAFSTLSPGGVAAPSVV